MARPRKTIETKKAQGTLEKSRELPNYVHHDIVRVMPEVSKDLNEDGKKFFQNVCAILMQKGLLTVAYIADIELHATWYSIYKIAERNIKKNKGYTQISKTGWNQISADIAALEKATKALVNFSTRYGLDLVSSQRINVPDIETDKLDN